MTARQKILALLTLIVALVLEIVDLTIVNTALPAIKADVGANAEASQWIIAGYSLSFALLLTAGGRMGDSFGYRRMFMIGVACAGSIYFTFAANGAMPPSEAAIFAVVVMLLLCALLAARLPSAIIATEGH